MNTDERSAAIICLIADILAIYAGVKKKLGIATRFHLKLEKQTSNTHM